MVNIPVYFLFKNLAFGTISDSAKCQIPYLMKKTIVINVLIILIFYIIFSLAAGK